MNSSSLCKKLIPLLAVSLPLTVQAVVLDYEAVPTGTVYNNVLEQGFVTAVKRCDSFGTVEACVKAGHQTGGLQYNASLGDDKAPSFLTLNWSATVKATAIISPEDLNAVFTLTGLSLATAYRRETSNVRIIGYDENLDKVVEATVNLTSASFNSYLLSGFDNLKAISLTGDRRFSFDKVEVTATSADKLACVGFDSPMDKSVSVKKNRALPYKAVLIDADGFEVTDADVSTPPVISVKYYSSASTESAVDVETLSPGNSFEGNQFAYVDGNWQFNLSTRNHSASGNYFVEMVSGDSNEYLIEPQCAGSFNVK
ncbi:hypothetical protein [Neptuniibacter sp. QD57_21]|uniref:hypothetical protein n=1 Tax=Neptuniibacter sp. QD57_21 TaxID=3398213 RepID=UPI0039F5CE27